MNESALLEKEMVKGRDIHGCMDFNCRLTQTPAGEFFGKTNARFFHIVHVNVDITSTFFISAEPRSTQRCPTATTAV
jgi:hypothetical protein